MCVEFTRKANVNGLFMPLKFSVIIFTLKLANIGPSRAVGESLGVVLDFDPFLTAQIKPNLISLPIRVT